MADGRLGLETLSEDVLNKLAEMLDNSNCSWRQLAEAVKEQPQFCYRYDLEEYSLLLVSGLSHY